MELHERLSRGLPETNWPTPGQKLYRVTLDMYLTTDLESAEWFAQNRAEKLSVPGLKVKVHSISEARPEELE